jgi:hypothetical protein
MSKPNIERLGRAADDDALRLAVAFFRIMEPARRADVLSRVEDLAKRSERVEGVTHFTDLVPGTICRI